MSNVIDARPFFLYRRARREPLSYSFVAIENIPRDELAARLSRVGLALTNRYGLLVVHRPDSPPPAA